MIQGELWLLETPNDKARPVMVVSRTEVIPYVRQVVVAPVTSAIRSIPTCIAVGAGEGLDHDSAASFDNRATVPKGLLTVRLGSLAQARRHEFCAALLAMADC